MNKIAIIDDEIDARRILKHYIKIHLPKYELIGEATGVKNGISLIKEHSPDIIFLDIQMDDGNGFDLIDVIKIDLPHIIFTTAFDEFALRAFQVNAIDYLLKPIDPERLVEAVKRTENLILPAAAANYKNLMSNERISVNTLAGTEFIKVDDITFIEADGSYSVINLLDKNKMIISKNVKHFAEKLQENPHFIRPHKSYLVNARHVDALVKDGNSFLKMYNGKLIPIARGQKNEISAFMSDFTW